MAMNLRRIASAGTKVVISRMAGKPYPLAIGWAVTGRCNLQCRYCAIAGEGGGDLPKLDMLRIVEGMAASGVMVVSFTGGEPLLREDMGEIAQRAKKLKISTGLSTNGSLVKECKDVVSQIDKIMLSIDGPQDIHDSVRGAGSFRKAMGALEYMREAGKKVTIMTVLSSKNLSSLEFMISLARDSGAPVQFQPASESLLGGSDPDPLCPPSREYRDAISRIIETKKKEGNLIASSLPTLEHLQRFPDPYPMRCAAGKLEGRIEPNGDLFYCGRVRYEGKPLNCLELGFEEAFRRLPPVKCSICWCASRIEMNLVYSLNPRAIASAIRIF